LKWVVAIAALLGAPALGLRATAHVERSAAVLPADGSASMNFRVRTRSLVGLAAPLLPSTRATLSLTPPLARASCGAGPHGPVCTVVSGTTPGELHGTLRLEDVLGTVAELPVALRLVADASDTDQDGFPDVVELDSEDDRAAFRRWFVTLAAAQYPTPDPRWPEVHRDCAGLLRYAYKEALKAHGPGWRKGRELGTASAPDVRKYRYPAVPLLGEHLFRVAPGPYDASVPPESTFSASASARWLLTANTVRVPRERALPGDLLFFEDLEARGMSYHSMVYLGDLGGLGPEIVYHTGPDSRPGGSRGIVKRLLFEDLLSHPDEKWRPRDDNPHFLGFYRWKILD
jgi:uncharacterized protein